jgi:hypothetical protein
VVRGWKIGINRVVMVMIKECGLRQEKEGKTKKKHVNGAMFLTPPLLMEEMAVVLQPSMGSGLDGMTLWIKQNNV